MKQVAGLGLAFGQTVTVHSIQDLDGSVAVRPNDDLKRVPTRVGFHGERQFGLGAGLHTDHKRVRRDHRIAVVVVLVLLRQNQIVIVICQKGI